MESRFAGQLTDGQWPHTNEYAQTYFDMILNRHTKFQSNWLLLSWSFWIKCWSQIDLNWISIVANEQITGLSAQQWLKLLTIDYNCDVKHNNTQNSPNNILVKMTTDHFNDSLLIPSRIDLILFTASKSIDSSKHVILRLG